MSYAGKDKTIDDMWAASGHGTRREDVEAAYNAGVLAEQEQQRDKTGVAMEPRIIINGIELTESQAMTLRVAVDSFTTNLQETGLGDDDNGKKMVEMYLNALRDISNIMAG